MHRVSLILYPIILLFSFQNCSPVSFNVDEAISSSLKADNGSVFDGKPTYYQTLPNYECEGAAAARASIQFRNDQALLSVNQKDQCGALNKQPIDPKEIDRSKFDADFIGYRDGIFERSLQAPDPTASVYNEAWCQSNSSDQPAVDVAIRFDQKSLQATSQIYFENQGQPRNIPAFPVARVMSDDEARYDAPSFSLVIDRSQPAPEKWWYFSAILKTNLETGPWSGSVRCRMQAGKLLNSVQKIYAQNGDWNSYVQRSSTAQNLFHQPDTSCTPGGQKWSQCFHAGDKLMVQTDSKKCSDLQIADSLQVFDWVCEDQPAGAVFYTTQLKKGRGLSDLVTSAGWKHNLIQIKENQHVIYESIPMPWWKNPVLPLPPNPTGSALTLSQAGAVYVAEASAVSQGYILSQSRISVVIKPGVTLTPATNLANNCGGIGMSSAPNGYSYPLKCLVSATGSNFLWIEGSFDSTGTNAMANISLANLSFARLHQVKARGSVGFGVYQSQVFSSVFNDVSTTDNQFGWMSSMSEGNLWGHILIQNNSYTGLTFRAWDNDNTLFDVQAVKNGIYGLQFNSSLNLTLISARASGHTNSGISVEGFTDNALFDSIFVSENNYGLDISRTSNGNQFGNRFQNMTLVGNQNGLRIMKDSGPTDANKETFDQSLRLGNALDCSVYVIGTGNYQASICPGIPGLGSEVYGSATPSLQTSCVLAQDRNSVLCNGKSWSQACRLPDTEPLPIAQPEAAPVCSSPIQ